jgi:hypothetical protein
MQPVKGAKSMPCNIFRLDMMSKLSNAKHKTTLLLRVVRKYDVLFSRMSTRSYTDSCVDWIVAAKKYLHFEHLNSEFAIEIRFQLALLIHATGN